MNTAYREKAGPLTNNGEQISESHTPTQVSWRYLFTIQTYFQQRRTQSLISLGCIFSVSFEEQASAYRFLTDVEKSLNLCEG